MQFFRSGFLSIAFTLVLIPTSLIAQGVVTTVAGTPWIFRGDGQAATSTPLGKMESVVVAPTGELFAADSENSIVVRVSSSGVLNIVAGNGLPGAPPDGLVARDVGLRSPASVALGPDGSLYLSDGVIGVWKVGTDGRINRVAGNDQLGFSGDGGPAKQATLGTPWGLAVDAAGNLYIADRSNHRIRKVNSAGIITTVAGNGVAGFSGDGGLATNASLNEPLSVAVDAAGNLFISDTYNMRVRKVSANGTIQTVAGRGNEGALFDGIPATSARIMPYGVALDSAGNLYIACSAVVVKVDPGGTLHLIAGKDDGTGPGFSGDGGPARDAKFNSVVGVVTDTKGNIFVADRDNRRIRRIDSSGTITTVAGDGRYKFGGDGGPARIASLHRPGGIAVGSDGSLYIADSNNHRLRRVAPGGDISTVAGTGIWAWYTDGAAATQSPLSTPLDVRVASNGDILLTDLSNRVARIDALGKITTVAGTGIEGFSGDGGPAASALFRLPAGIALDSAGSLYVADKFNHRIRKVANGIITTIAGSGPVGYDAGSYSGDGGAATAATLKRPNAVALDSAGNLYIADTENHRIRKITPGGIITTFAGNGTAGFSGDGGPATAASLAYPSSVFADAAGNLYILTQGNARIRKVDTGGTITTVVGGGQYLRDGVQPTDAAIEVVVCFPCVNGMTLDGAGNLYYSEWTDRVRRVSRLAPAFAVSPLTFTFIMPAGKPVPPFPLAISGDTAGIGWTSSVVTQDGAKWLAVDPDGGQVPAGALVVLTPVVLSLAPGTYHATVTFTAPQAVPSTQTVSVTLNVTQALPPQLAVEPPSMTFEMLAGSGARTQGMRIGNSGGGTLDWKARAEVFSGSGWLSITPASGTVTPGSPALLQVTANVSSLQPGAYQGVVVVEAGPQIIRVPVNLLLAGTKQTLLVSQLGLSFTAVEGGSVIPSQMFAVLNAGEGTMSWKTFATMFSGGSSWLTAAPSSGTSDPASLKISEVEVKIDVTGLKAGRYQGFVEVQAAGARNSPQIVSIDLDVLPRGTASGPLVRPMGLIFAARAGSAPASQAVAVGTPSATATAFAAGLLTTSGGEWLDARPRNASVSALAPVAITVQPTAEKLSAGIYRGALTLLFDDGNIRNVHVLFVVVSGSLATASSDAWPADASCTPTKLLAVLRSLGNTFSAGSGLPIPVEVQVVDDCANSISSATVVASFSSGDPTLVLTPLKGGIYAGTWRPATTASQVTVTVRATSPPLQQAEIQAVGQVSSQATVPAVFSGGVVDAASYSGGRALAPGMIVSVFGRNLATGVNLAPALPLAQTLGGATMSIGGEDVPLFFTSDGQINAQLPFTLVANSRVQVYVKAKSGGTGAEMVSVPETITISDAQPAIFSMNQAGTGQGAIINTSYQLVDSSHPTSAGNIVLIYGTGFGAVDQQVKAGEAAPLDKLCWVTVPVTATVGGKSAEVQFAGLAPGYAGLYQVNVKIPDGVTAGASVPVVLSQNGVSSNTVTIAVQ